MSTASPQRQPHASLDLRSRNLKAVKIERLLDLAHRHQPIRMLEIGTGSGGIAHYFATHPTLHCEVMAVDERDALRAGCTRFAKRYARPHFGEQIATLLLDAANPTQPRVSAIQA